MTSSLTSTLLDIINANGALSSLFSSPTSFGNPLSLAAAAEQVQAAENAFPSQQVLALSGLFSRLRTLRAAAAPLLAPSSQANSFLVQTGSPVMPQAYTQTSVRSSNTAVTATSQPGATITSYQVGVTQLGVAQVNAGMAFASTTLNSAGANINAGAGQVRVAINGGPTAEASYYIYGSDTNQQALQAVASAINSISTNHDLQTIALSPNASSGTFKLSFNGQTTGAIAVAGLTAATIQSALEGLGGVGVGNVSVTQSGNNAFSVAFKGTLDDRILPQLQAQNIDMNSGATISTDLVQGPVASLTNTATTSALTITARTTGSANAFTATDAPGSNGIAQSGAGAATTNAQDAIYSLNGAVYRATSGNAASIDNGKVSLTFLATTSTPATITVSANTSSLSTSVEAMATAYNSLQSFLDENSQVLAPHLAQEAENIISSHSSTLASLGISGTSRLTVNESTLTGANPSTVQQVFAGSQGIATQLSGLSEGILSSLQGPLAASQQTPSNNSEVATALAGLFEQTLLGEQLGGNLSLKA